MKPMTYYEQGQGWKMPRWLMAVLGAAFVVTLTAQGWLMRTLLKPPVTAVALHAPVAPPPAPAVAPAAPSDAVAAPDADPTTAAAAPVAKHAHHKIARAASKHPARRGLSDSQAHTILAHHDSKSKRRQLDDLDRLMR